MKKYEIYTGYIQKINGDKIWIELGENHKPILVFRISFPENERDILIKDMIVYIYILKREYKIVCRVSSWRRNFGHKRKLILLKSAPIV